MTHFYTTSIFAQAYSQGTYGSGTYNGQATSTTGTTGSGGGGAGTTGSLVDTGLVIAIIVTVACLIIFAALIARFWKRPKKNKDNNDSQLPSDQQ